MREAEITCLTRMVRIPDLGLEMTKGDVEYVSEKGAQASSDLTMMREMNAVGVIWVHRGNRLREEPKTTRRRRRPVLTAGPPPGRRPNRTPQPTPPDVQTPGSPPHRQATPPQVDLELLADMLAARLGGEIHRVITAVKENRPVVVSGGAALPSGSQAPAGTVDDEMPMFMPSKIVDHDAKADIKTKKSTGSADGIDDARAALKKARKGRKKEK